MIFYLGAYLFYTIEIRFSDDYPQRQKSSVDLIFFSKNNSRIVEYFGVASDNQSTVIKKRALNGRNKP
nr:hypothetical protein [uncultured Carboxylicivirga sp.]